VAASYGNMAIVHERQGHYEESDRLFEEGHSIGMKVYGYHHPIVAQFHVNKAWISIKATPAGPYTTGKSKLPSCRTACTNQTENDANDATHTLRHKRTRTYTPKCFQKHAEALCSASGSTRKQSAGIKVLPSASCRHQSASACFRKHSEAGIVLPECLFVDLVDVRKT
jgi:hypothetical protein